MSTVVSTVRDALRLISVTLRRRLMLAGLVALAVSGLEAVSAVFVLVLLNLVLDPGSMSDMPVIGDPRRFAPGLDDQGFVLLFSGLFIAFFLIRAAAFIYQQYYVTRVCSDTAVELGGRLFSGYLRMPYEFHLRRNSSELVRNAFDSTTQIAESVFTPIAVVFADSVLVVMMLGVLLISSPGSTVAAALVMGVAVAVTLRFLQPRLRSFGQQRHVAAQGSLHHLQQGLDGLRDVKVLGREGTFAERFLESRREMAAAQYWRQTLSYVPRTTIETVFLFLVLGLLAFATVRGSTTSMLSALGLFAYAGMRIQPSLQKISLGLNALRFADAPLRAVEADLELVEASGAGEDELRAQPEPLPFERAIVFHGLSFRYEDAERNALDGIDLVIRRGESIGICGHTGGGKSTLVDVLCGLLPPMEGLITVDGVEFSDDVRAWQRNIGIVHQSSFLVDDTLRRNIAFGVPDGELDHVALDRAVRAAELADVVSSLPDGLDTVVGERGVRLSGGQRQRVTLARALYRRPRLLILDEGTSALDNETESAVMRNLGQLQHEMTLVMVAHRLTTIQKCDRILFLEDGRLDAVGTYEELQRTSPRFRAMSL